MAHYAIRYTTRDGKGSVLISATNDEDADKVAKEYMRFYESRATNVSYIVVPVGS